MKETKDGSRIINYILIFFIGCLVMYGIMYFFPTTITENITKTQKEVTISENTGISEAVDKVYNSVVVVNAIGDNTSASGTGFVYKKDNKKYYVLTNHHVIEDGKKITVTLTDGSVIESNLVGSDQYADIAVLSLESDKDLEVAELGKSEDMKVGDTVFAIGSPLDSIYSWSVTRGIVSGKDRMLEVPIGNSQTNDYVMKVIQTDAAINYGNSGGPLCNAEGNVIGINSSKLVKTGVEGMGFAIPIETALAKAEEIVSGKAMEYPYLGISMVDFNTVYSSYQAYQLYHELVKDSGLSKGVIVHDVAKKSGAAEAGLKQGDIIIAIDGEEVKNQAYLKYYLYQHKVDDKITLKIYRDGKEKEITVKLGTNKETI